MGIFFTSTQIYNPKQLDCDGFKAYFCEKMKKDGYEVCDEDSAELSYVLAFADNCKWVTLSSEAYEQGNRTAQTDTARIAKMLGTYCVNTIVIDSDCAMLDLYDDKGKKADTAVMGRADDYLGDDIPAPVKAVWEQFVSPNSTWEQFMSVVQGDYVFVEDGLSELAPVIEMDGGNILFEYDDADENNENFCYLSFRKASSKKEKKLTLNAAFKQIIGKALEPYGFKIIKGRHPYIVRIINNEIIHIITFCPESPEYPEDKAFAIMCGVATIYRKKITFDLSPKENHEWLDYMSSFYTALTHENDSEILGQLYKSCYYSDKADSLTSVLTANSESIIKYVLPIMDKIKDIDSCLDYMQEFMMPCNTKKCAKICTYYPDEDESFLYFLSEKIKKNPPDFLNSFLNDNEFHSQTLEELARRKKYNLEILKSYGIDSEKTQPKKEKTLTLNSAFVKIFGETLEPLGFVKIKSKHPYFVRVVNNEIIHIISYTNTRQKYHNKQPFTIIGGAFSVYRRNFNLDVKPYDNWDSLLDNHKIYSYSICEETYDLNYRKSICNFTCEIDNNDSIISTMKSSLEVTEKIMLTYLNKLDSIESYFKELVINNSFELLTESPEELIFYNIDNFEEITRTALNKKADMYKKCVELNRKGYTNENYENIINNLENYVQEIVAPIKANISESASEYVKESEYNKKKNIEKLKSYGIDSEKPQPKKEKKLTLNAAFKQVFGELLEPMGFKLVKSKHPYFVRVVNGEILQVITIVSRPDKRFEILGGIATVYRQSLSLNLDPQMNESWLIGNFYYYQQLEITNEKRKYSSNEIYEFYGADLLEKEMKRAFTATKKIILDIFDKVNSLEKCVEFYNFFGMDIRIHHKDDFGNSYPINYYNEGLLIIKTMNLEQYSSLMDKYKEITINRRKKQITNGGIPYERLMNEQEVFKNQKINEYKDLLDDKDWLATVDIELNNRRNHNIRLLEEYGLI